MKLCRYNSQKGFTIIEVLVALFIIALIIMGGGMFFFYGRVNIIREAHRRAAVLVASQRLEELKGAEWWPSESAEPVTTDTTVTTVDNLPSGNTVTTYAQYFHYDGDLTYDYSEVRVTVEWHDSTTNTVSSTTLIAP